MSLLTDEMRVHLDGLIRSDRVVLATGRPTDLSFSVINQMSFRVPDVATLRLVRNPRREFDQKLEVWLAPGLAFLPARIRITEANGDYVDQKWSSSESADSP